MPVEDTLERRLRKLAVEHAEVRWLTLRIDDAAIELREDLRAVKAMQEEHTAKLEAIDSQLRSLTQMVGQVLDRLPEK